MAIQNRYEFMYYVACTNCNPNGDPDMGNMPRLDPQTMQGFITDAATKRRIRNYVELAHQGEPGMNIIIQQATNINRHRDNWMLSDLTEHQRKRAFSVISCLLYLCNAICPDNTVKQDIKNLFASYPNIPIFMIGFTRGWEENPIWR